MKFEKILIPVSGTEANEEAIKLACRLVKQDKGSLCAVYVIPVERALPLDAEIKLFEKEL